MRTRTPPWRIIVGVWALAALLVLWSAPDVRGYVSAKESLPAHGALLAAVTRVETISEASGLLAARRWIDGWVSPLQHTAHLLGEPEPPVAEASLVEESAAVVAPPEAPAPGPGARWIGPDDPGGDRVDSVLLVGASSMQYYLGTELERRLEADYPDVRVHRLGKLGTGLVRDDVFDWAEQLHDLQVEHQPDVVVAQFGGNDAQAIHIGDKRIGFGLEGWDEAYRDRLIQVMRQVRDDGAVPVFIGMPVMRDEGFSGRIERVNRVTQEAAAIAGGRYVPSWDLAAQPNGTYKVEVEFDGERGRMRLQDGIHYSRLGARYLAHHLAQRLEQHVSLVPADEALAVTVHREIDSEARGKRVPYLAFVPRDVPPEGLPLLVLLHGAWDGWTAWSDHAHRELQALATQHRLVIVLPDGEPFGWYLDSDRVAGNKIATHLTAELLPDIAEHLPVDGRVGLGGLSMGGNGAIVTALRNPGLALSVSSMSGALDLEAAKSRKQLQELLGPFEDDPDGWRAWSTRDLLRAHPERARALALRLHCGSEDRRWIASNRTVHAELEAAGIPHVWEEVPGGHTWDVWRAALPDHVAWHAAVLHAAPPAGASRDVSADAPGTTSDTDGGPPPG